MSQAEQALTLVMERGEMRSSAIAELLDCTAANVHELLMPAVARGELVACDVEAGGARLKDYRVAASPKPAFRRSRPEELKPPTPLPAEQPAAPEQPKEVHAVSIKDKIVAALKRGPMKTRALHAVIGGGGAYLSTTLSKLAAEKAIERVGFGTYGLPGTKADDAPQPRRLPKKRTGGGRRMQRKRKADKGATARKAWTTRRAAARSESAALAGLKVLANGFRPAITADGALLLIGQEKAGELNRGETRVLAEFLRRVDRTGVRA